MPSEPTPLEALTPPPGFQPLESPAPAADGQTLSRVALHEHLARLRGLVRQALRARHYSPGTEAAYLAWIGRFVAFHRRPAESLGPSEIAEFLASLATGRRVAASTQNQARSALLFLYRDALGREASSLQRAPRARCSSRLPVVLARAECATLLEHLRGPLGLMAALMYGSGLRLRECCRLRIQDLDFDRAAIIIRDGKGAKDRVTILPSRLVEPLRSHLQQVRRLHAADLDEGAGCVELPSALEHGRPSAAWEWRWQWVFPSARLHHGTRDGRRQRRPMDASRVQRAFKAALRAAGIQKDASCHSLRHYAGSRIMPGGIAERLRIGGSLAA